MKTGRTAVDLAREHAGGIGEISVREEVRCLPGAHLESITHAVPSAPVAPATVFVVLHINCEDGVHTVCIFATEAGARVCVNDILEVYQRDWHDPAEITEIIERFKTQSHVCDRNWCFSIEMEEQAVQS